MIAFILSEETWAIIAFNSFLSVLVCYDSLNWIERIREKRKFLYSRAMHRCRAFWQNWAAIIFWECEAESIFNFLKKTFKANSLWYREEDYPNLRQNNRRWACLWALPWIFLKAIEHLIFIARLRAQKMRADLILWFCFFWGLLEEDLTLLAEISPKACLKIRCCFERSSNNKILGMLYSEIVRMVIRSLL